jgi:hypothetical protein
MKVGVVTLGLIACVISDAEERRFAVFSPNQSLVAEVRLEEKQAEFTLLKVKGASAEALWKGSFPSDPWVPRVHILESPPVLVFQSPRPNWSDGGVLRFFTDGKLVREWKPEAIEALLPAEQTSAAADNASSTASPGLDALLKEVRAANRDFELPLGSERLWNSDEILAHFEMVQGQRLFCVWFDRRDAWLAWNPLNGDSLPVTSTMEGDLNRATRIWAKRQVDSVQPQGRGSSDAANEFLKIPDEERLSYEPENQEDDTKLAYRFLTRRKNPEDRAVVEHLLTAEASVHSSGGSQIDAVTGEKMLYFSASSFDRSLGDYLLARWDGKIAPNTECQEQADREDYRYLASINGVVEFPSAVTNGSLWVYLIPNQQPAGSWKTNGAVMTASEDVASAMRSHTEMRGFSPFTGRSIKNKPETLSSNKLAFGFAGATPGTYRLKAVWDPSTSTAATTNPLSVPQSWRLESAEVGSITLAAGRMIQNLRLSCTNTGAAPLRVSSREVMAEPNIQADSRVQIEVMAATCRYMVARLFPRLSAAPSAVFLAVGEHGKPDDPPNALLEKLNGERVSLKAFGAAKLRNGEFIDEQDQHPCPVIQLSPIEWQGEEAIVPGKLMRTADKLNYSATRYVAVQRAGAWTVIGEQTGY